MKTYDDIVKYWSEAKARIEDLERSLRELRDDVRNWELDVEKDTRHSVRMLWSALKSERASLNAFLATAISVDKS